jgi:uncharacterized membrane protein YfcA
VIGPSVGAVAAPARARSLWAALAAGAGVGLLGGLIGLGGAEFRLPLLIGLFGFAALQAVIMNKAMSLIVVVTALPARLVSVPFDTVSGYWFVWSTCSPAASSAPGWGPPGLPECALQPSTGSWPRSWC